MFGVVSLLVVAALWGSYSPVLKFLFSQPSPPSAALMTASQALLAAAFLLAGNVGAGGGAGPGGRAGKAGAAAAQGPGLMTRLGRAVLGLVLGVAAALRSVLFRAGRVASRSPLRSTFFRSSSLGRQASALPLVQSGSGADASGDGGHSPSKQPAEALAAGAGAVSGRGGERGTPHRSASVGAGKPGLGPSSGRDSSGGGGALGGPAGGGRGAGRGGGGNLLSRPLGSLAAVGLELGAYNFFAVALGTWGVQRISATKVAFLGQATSLITPMLVALSGQRVAAVVWGACCCGALGGALVALDGSGGAAAAVLSAAAGVAAGQDGGVGGSGSMAPPLLSAAAMAAGAAAAAAGVQGQGPPQWGSSRAMRLEGPAVLSGTQAAPGAALVHHSLPPALSQESMGVNYVLASCVFYALGTVRLGVHSGRFPPLDLAAAAALAYAALALGWLLLEVIVTPSGSGGAPLAQLGLLLRDNATLALVLWAGLGPGALSSYLQVLGQRIVPAAQAQMLYSSTPLWSALLARLLLRGHDGPMGPLAWLGGAVMLTASLSASLLDALLAGRRAVPGGGRAGEGAGPAAAAAVLAPGGAGPGLAAGRWVSEDLAGVMAAQPHRHVHLREEERDL